MALCGCAPASAVAWGSWWSAAQIPERRGKQTKAGVQPEAPAATLIGWLYSPNEEDWRIWWAVMLSDTTEQGLWQLADRLATKDSQRWLEVWKRRRMKRQEWRRTKQNECRWRKSQSSKGREKKRKKGAGEVITSRALRRSRRGLVLSLSSSAWLASGSVLAGSPGSGSVWVAGGEPLSSEPSCCFCTSSESLSWCTDKETMLGEEKVKKGVEKKKGGLASKNWSRWKESVQKRGMTNVWGQYVGDEKPVRSPERLKSEGRKKWKM